MAFGNLLGSGAFVFHSSSLGLMQSPCVNELFELAFVNGRLILTSPSQLSFTDFLLSLSFLNLLKCIPLASV